MLSSSSGSQRLSQAALSRSRFLRLAAGALLPFVGWRLSAAAAANPNWLRVARSEPRMRRHRAAWEPSSSRVRTRRSSSYLRPTDGLRVNQMIEGPKVIVIFDGHSCCRTPTELRHTCRRSASRSIGSFSRMRRPITGAVSGADRAFPRRSRSALTGSPTRSAPEARRGSMASTGLRRQGRDEGHRSDGDDHRRSATDRRRDL